MSSFKLLPIIGMLIVGVSFTNPPTGEESSDQFFQKADRFFKNHVKSNGFVDYKNIAINPGSLDELVAMIKTTNLEELVGRQKKAFLINVYNILVIEQVIDNYPIASTKEVSGFFHDTQYKIGDRFFSLDELETYIFQEFEDPAMRFSLVCAARGCPPLANIAITPSHVESQIIACAEMVLNDNDFIRVSDKDKTVYISEIFRWYDSDFGENPIEYINRFRRKLIPTDYDLDFYIYGWSLNDTDLMVGKKKIRYERRYSDD